MVDWGSFRMDTKSWDQFSDRCVVLYCACAESLATYYDDSPTVEEILDLCNKHWVRAHG